MPTNLEEAKTKISTFLKENNITTTLFLILLLIISYIFIFKQENSTIPPQTDQTSTSNSNQNLNTISPPQIPSTSPSSTNSSHQTIRVDIQGAVKLPGVYELNSNQIINDLIQKAGGFTSQVDKDFINKFLNKAQTLKDEMKIYIPKISDNYDQSKITSNPLISGGTESINTSPQNRLISINNASIDELTILEGVGIKTATKIYENRPYSQIEDLIDKEVITNSLFKKIQEKITL